MISPFRRYRSRTLGTPFLTDDEAASPTVIASRSFSEIGNVQEEVVRTDARVADLLLSLVRETAAARNDESQLLAVICDFAFRAFPSATHHILAVLDETTCEFRPLIAQSRDGAEPKVALSRTIVSRVVREGVALLVTLGRNDKAAADSIALSGLETAICAPLMNRDRAVGIIQLDIRRPGKGVFSRNDVDLLSVFASQVSLTLDHLGLYHQQHRAFQSTISALVHSLNLKDPETAHHCERVQAVAIELGRELGLPDAELEVLAVAAILHDLGKQGVRDEVLFSSSPLSEEERDEMAQHATHTQTILDKIEYPERLREVPKVAAYHHEKMDATGPFGIPGQDIPRASRIIAVADAFDALITPRAYKPALPVDEVVNILERGKGVDWDPQVVRTLRQIIPDLETTVYAAPDPPVANDRESGLPLEEAA